MSWRSVLGDGLFSLPHSLGCFLSLFILNILSTSNPDFSSDIQNWTSNSDTFRWICNTHLRPNMSQTQHQIIAIKPPSFTKSIILGNGNVTVSVAHVKPWSLIWAPSLATHVWHISSFQTLALLIIYTAVILVKVTNIFTWIIVIIYCFFVCFCFNFCISFGLPYSL